MHDSWQSLQTMWQMVKYNGLMAGGREQQCVRLTLDRYRPLYGSNGNSRAHWLQRFYFMSWKSGAKNLLWQIIDWLIMELLLRVGMKIVGLPFLPISRNSAKHQSSYSFIKTASFFNMPSNVCDDVQWGSTRNRIRFLLAKILYLIVGMPHAKTVHCHDECVFWPSSNCRLMRCQRSWTRYKAE